MSAHLFSRRGLFFSGSFNFYFIFNFRLVEEVREKTKKEYDRIMQTFKNMDDDIKLLSEEIVSRKKELDELAAELLDEPSSSRALPPAATNSPMRNSLIPNRRSLMPSRNAPLSQSSPIQAGQPRSPPRARSPHRGRSPPLSRSPPRANLRAEAHDYYQSKRHDSRRNQTSHRYERSPDRSRREYRSSERSRR